MSKDIEVLTAMNAKIIEAENNGDREWLASILAPRFVMQRANGDLDDRDSFLRSVTAGGDRASRMVEPVRVYGNRALVQFVVSTRGRKIDNLQLFVRREGEWKLIGWFNEPA